jgi:hypothetical protein
MKVRVSVILIVPELCIEEAVADALRATRIGSEQIGSDEIGSDEFGRETQAGTGGISRLAREPVADRTLRANTRIPRRFRLLGFGVRSSGHGKHGSSFVVLSWTAQTDRQFMSSCVYADRQEIKCDFFRTLFPRSMATLSSLQSRGASAPDFQQGPLSVQPYVPPTKPVGSSMQYATFLQVNLWLLLPVCCSPTL